MTLGAKLSSGIMFAKILIPVRYPVVWIFLQRTQSAQQSFCSNVVVGNVASQSLYRGWEEGGTETTPVLQLAQKKSRSLCIMWAGGVFVWLRWAACLFYTTCKYCLLCHSDMMIYVTFCINKFNHILLDYLINIYWISDHMQLCNFDISKTSQFPWLNPRDYEMITDI